MKSSQEEGNPKTESSPWVDDLAFVVILRACAKTKNLRKGMRVHASLLKSGLLEKGSREADTLVSMYAKCGVLAKAKDLLDGLLVRDVFSWSDLIAGYVQQGQGQEALDLFERMQYEGVSPDAVTFSCALKACGSIGAIDKGEQIHEGIAQQGLLRKNIVLGTALVDMYAKCGALGRAQQVLDELLVRDVFSWTALITGYAQQGQSEEALYCFKRMQGESLSPDALTLASILKACGTIGAIEKGEQIHSEIAKQGFLGNDIVLSTALVDMYAKCGSLKKAARVLDELPVRDVFSWTALIAGSAQQDQGEEALKYFQLMQLEGFSPNTVTWACILKACGSIGETKKGEQIHDEIAKQGFLGNNILLGNALVDMYAKCGALTKAQQVLDKLPALEVVSWNSLITGYAQQGQIQDALNCFEQMQRKGLPPDAVTFLCVLNACSHSGLVYEGQVCFANMSTINGTIPNLEHYACMIDLYGRAGHLNKAVAVIEKMPSCDHLVVWLTLLGACRKWGDVNVGRWAFEHAVQIDKSDTSAYVLMANIYTAAGMQEDAEDIEAMSVENAWRTP